MGVDGDTARDCPCNRGRATPQARDAGFQPQAVARLSVAAVCCFTAVMLVGCTVQMRHLEKYDLDKDEATVCAVWYRNLGSGG